MSGNEKRQNTRIRRHLEKAMSGLESISTNLEADGRLLDRAEDSAIQTDWQQVESDINQISYILLVASDLARNSAKEQNHVN